jgi:uncharacterized protein DUF6874
MLNMHVSANDLEKIIKIMLRAASMLDLADHNCDRLSLCLDLSACHANGCALDLDGLLCASGRDFAHDICGIMKHIDRKTGKLTDCFLPHYACK